MSYPVYYVPAGDVLPIFFDTFDGGTGASITMTGFAVTDIEIYKDGSVTQRASDAGYTLLDTDGIDFDGLTGIHGFSIDTGDNTDAGFYSVGAWYHVVVSAVTVDAQAVSFVAAAFRIMKAESVAGVPKADVDAWLGTAAATPTVAGVPEVDVTHVGGTAQTAGDLKASLNIIDDFLDTEIAAIIATLGAAGAGLTAIPWNAAWDAESESEVLDALNTILADSVPADGTIPTLRQAIYMIWQFLAERSVSGTTVTVKKADGSTALMTFTLNDPTDPTSITRAT